ncbi:2-dehydro-3-deoxygalactonokinase [Methylovirgula sp. 4M-Z18]|uniref:2-dehydro-3-deoxygalactonokinase n=1 Tax=Methylovirgula sp. 4M-Z18 TaxID=2293567 RepID=UPI00131490A3|nr:2-dehydro-3-deoxygalactonokinase [Methylovirgula sp. 4M-Z18]
MNKTFVGVDWGTSSLRAYLADAGGKILAVHRSSAGIQQQQGAFESTLGTVLTELAAPPHVPVLMAGMIGSRQGWIEAPYVETPCDAKRLAAGLADVPNGLGRDIRIVPGLCDLSGPAPDVMRGEETQLLGLLRDFPSQYGAVVMPGTHSKWVRVQDGRILGFATYMTGEMFKVLKDHTILGRLMPAESPDDPEAFAQGVDHAGSSGHFLNHIFSARTFGLFDRLPAASLKSYLSGLVIGHEVRAAAGGASGPVAIVADQALAALYAQALQRIGCAHETAPDHIVLRGLSEIARSADLVS